MASRKRPSLRDNITPGGDAVATAAEAPPAAIAEETPAAPEPAVAEPITPEPALAVTEPALTEIVSAEPPPSAPVPVAPLAMETVVSSAPSETVESPVPEAAASAAISAPTPAFVPPPAPVPARSRGAFVLAAVATVLATAGLAATATIPYWSPDVRKQASVTQALEGRIGTMETRLGASAAAGAPLADRIAALESSLGALDRKIAALPDAKAFGALAIAQLTEALSDSDPFAAELVAVRASGIADESLKTALDGIAPRAATGIPTSGELAQRFMLMVPEALAADLRAAVAEAEKAQQAAATATATPAPAAPAAPPPAAPADGTVTADAAADAPGYLDQFWSLLYGAADLLRVPSLPSFGTGEVRKAATVLEQTGALLVSGDMVAAVEVLAMLEGPAAEAAAPWLADARARVAADRTVTLLGARAAALLPTKS